MNGTMILYLIQTNISAVQKHEFLCSTSGHLYLFESEDQAQGVIDVLAEDAEKWEIRPAKLYKGELNGAGVS